MHKHSDNTYTLYWEYLAGSIVVQAMLEEVGAEYSLCHVDMASDEHLSMSFRSKNPTGRVPALGISGGEVIGETGAIITYLTEIYQDSEIAPSPGERCRATFLFWLNVLTTSGYMTAARVGHPERYAQDESAVAQVAAKAFDDYDAFFDVIEHAIAGVPFFMSRGLTVLDFYISMLTEWHHDRDALFNKRPKLSRLCGAVNATEVYRKTMNTHELQSVA